MRTLTFEPGRCCLVETPAPAPGPGQVLLRLRGTVLDETHLADYRLGKTQAPYLVYGEVLQPGAGVIGWRPGQPAVTIFRGELGHYLLQPAEQILSVEQSRAASCLLLGITLGQRAVRAAEEFPESTVIGGAGFVGLALSALLHTTTPWVFGWSEAALLCAKDLGATHCKEWDQALAELEQQPVQERGFGTVFIETTGRHQNRDWAQRLTLKGGKIILATPPGAGNSQLKIDATRLHYDQITWQALGPVTQSQLNEATQLLEKIPDSLVSDCLPLSQIETAFAELDAERGVCYLLSDDSDN